MFTVEYFFLLSNIAWQRVFVSAADSPYQARVPVFQFLRWLISSPEDCHLTGRCLGHYAAPPSDLWQTGVGLWQLSLLASTQGNFYVVSIYTPICLWAQSEPKILLKPCFCLASSPTLSCFPFSFIIFSWNHPSVSHPYRNPCLRFCFLGIQPRTACKIFVNKDQIHMTL